MTAKGLVEYAEKAYREGWGYCLGTYGQILTKTLLTQKCNQGNGVGSYNKSNLSYLNKFINGRVSDCYGIVKGYCWSSGGTREPVYASNGMPDRNQEGAYNSAKEKGPISTIPEVPGVVLWMKGHAGVYIGNGQFIECAGAPTGMFKGRIENGKVVSGSKFTHWFKDTAIDYIKNEGELDMSQYEELKEAINRIEKKLESINTDLYKTLSDIPDWGKPTVTKLVNKKFFADTKNLDISYDFLRNLVILDRAGLFS